MYTNRLGEEKQQVVEWQEACFCSDGCMNQHFDDEVHDLHVEGAVNQHMAAAMNHTRYSISSGLLHNTSADHVTTYTHTFLTLSILPHTRKWKCSRDGILVSVLSPELLYERRTGTV